MQTCSCVALRNIKSDLVFELTPRLFVFTTVIKIIVIIIIIIIAAITINVITIVLMTIAFLFSVTCLIAFR